jgi:transketolase
MDKNSFKERVYSVKKRFLGMYKNANAGHIACSLSCADILVFLRFFWLADPESLIVSKGHAAAAIYSVLAEAGDLTEAEIATFCREGTFLGAHPPVHQIKGIPFATGSLGHGLSLTAGRALAGKLKKEPKLFFCLTSDGELNEGSTWEAILFSAQQKLANLVWLIDRNRIQGFGRTEEVMALEPLGKKLQDFGFFTVTANGHDFDSLMKAKQACEQEKRLPKVIICETVKGHGVSFMEDTVDWHYLPMKEQDYEKALSELEAWRSAQ